MLSRHSTFTFSLVSISFSRIAGTRIPSLLPSVFFPVKPLVERHGTLTGWRQNTLAVFRIAADLGQKKWRRFACGDARTLKHLMSWHPVSGRNAMWSDTPGLTGDVGCLLRFRLVDKRF